MHDLAHITPEARLAALDIVLPPAPMPVARFANARRVGELLYLSGQTPRRADGSVIAGLVGADVSLADAYGQARLVGLTLLAVLREALGSLDEVEGVVKLLGMIRATPDFTDHPAVLDGCSNLFVDVFGPLGSHARSAVGIGSLPMQATLEIEAIFHVRSIPANSGP